MGQVDKIWGWKWVFLHLEGWKTTRFLLRNTGDDSDFTKNFWGKNWRVGALLVVVHVYVQMLQSAFCSNLFNTGLQCAWENHCHLQLQLHPPHQIVIFGTEDWRRTSFEDKDSSVKCSKIQKSKFTCAKLMKSVDNLVRLKLYYLY